jgi:hypothetical protein
MLKPKVLIVGFLLMIGFTASFAGARQVTAINGSPALGSERSCFDFPDGGNPSRLKQVCTGYRDWLIDVPLNNVTTTTVKRGRSYARGNGSNLPVTCYIDSASLSGETGGNWIYGERGSTSWGPLSFNGSSDWGVWVPADGTIHAYCSVPQFGGLTTVSFNP